jgi:hypothetical protein
MLMQSHSERKPLETRSDTVVRAYLMSIEGAFATISLRVVAVLNRWLSPEPPPFYGWPDDSK